ncbi:PTS sugar transporter subunit IIC, partial [Enterococcus faecalis]
IICGLLVGGWQAALVQVVLLTLSFFIYLPFEKKLDALNYAQETNQPITEESLEKVEKLNE